jgi:hypothetical protein
MVYLLPLGKLELLNSLVEASKMVYLPQLSLYFKIFLL